MIDFLNEHLPNLNIPVAALQPIYIDNALIEEHLNTFNNSLFINLKDYYLSKNNSNFIKYSLFNKILSNKHNSKNFMFTLTNNTNKHSIVVSTGEKNQFVKIDFYLNVKKYKIDTNSKVKGKIRVLSNFINNGISVQLLDILYQYLENEYFDDNNLFCNILIN